MSDPMVIREITVRECRHAHETGNVTTLTSAEKRRLERSLLPLPHEFAVEERIVLAPKDVGVRTNRNPGSVIENGVGRLQRLFKDRTGISPEGNGFVIRVGVLDENGEVAGKAINNAGRLKQLPNRDQAYLIERHGVTELIVAGLHDNGVFHGITTLCQLLEATPPGRGVSIPLVSLVDWPDFSERGFWHMPLNHVPWLATMKMNHFHCTTHFEARSGGKLVPAMTTNIRDPEASAKWAVPFETARVHAAKVVPGIGHLDFWEPNCPGLADHYPELIGKGERAKAGLFAQTGARTPCASNPKLTDVLASLMASIASWGVSEVCAWASEYPGGQCECAKCVEEGQFQAEVRSILTAWRRTREEFPDLKLRIFFGAGGFAPGEKWFPNYPAGAADEIIASLPDEVRLGVSNGFDERTLSEFAARGGWVSRYYVAVLSFWNRFAAGDIQQRMQFFHSKGYRGVSQYFQDYYWDDVRGALDFQLCALAEYSWNTTGRSPVEFAEAWAARRGYDHPEAFGQWVTMMTERGVAKDIMEEFLTANPSAKETLEERYRFVGRCRGRCRNAEPTQSE